MFQGNELEIKSSICGRYCSKTSKMLKRLVNERLTAAADEIFALFERTIASYEEELSRTKEENEQQRQQLEAVSKTSIVLHTEDVLHEESPPLPQGGSSTLKQKDPKPPHIKEEEDELWITQEGEYYTKLEEDGLPLLPLTVVSVKTEDHEDKPADNLLAPLSDCDDTWSHFPEDADRDNTQEALSSDAGCEGVQNLISRQEEPQRGSITLENKDPQSPHIKKEEEEELWISQEGECVARQEEADLSKLPLTVVSVKIKDDKDEPQEDFLAPLSDSADTSHSPEAKDGDATHEPLDSDTDCEGDMRTRTDNKPSEVPEKKTGKKCLTCPVCAKSFSDKRYFPLHMRTHTGEKPFSCSICDKRFSQNSHLLSHVRTHTGEKPFSCSVCDERFSKKSNIVNHMRTHTGEKPFGCSVCEAKFAKRFTLKRHMTTHTREKPFSCSVCGEGFAVEMSLIRHQRTHTVEKPFSCPVCDKRFSHKSNMNAHMRIHTGEKAFNCSVCGKNYSYRASLSIHMRKHKGE
ncbi:uncharacterized protein [Nerophis lumbriciformis]|uniref:uncharacterized protein n=1 Tax=Nerophis lumbriciformis TaxID=546530 RepID=UPI002ADF0503|nr:zinc finger protein 771-like [Nerophis lumbriciformis]